MSTRYVWGKYDITQKYEKNTTIVTVANLINSRQDDIYANSTYSENPENGTFRSGGSGTILPVENTSRPYIVDTGKEPNSGDGNIMYEKKDDGWWRMSGIGRFQCYATRYDNPGVEFYKHEYALTDAKGDLQGYASSATDGAYPADGVSGNVWYTKQGSDNIDPSACSIPSTIMGGTQIQITVTPGTGKVYEGTVSYLYQVKLGDADWTTIATTTATSKNYTVPYGTTTFQVRVRAQDNLGFTSTDYVTSSSVTVINNQPPTAPGSIEVTNVVSGQQCTITITAATDPDGTVESYIYERSVDGSAWQQIANVNALTHNDTINAEWGTVAYRVKAVDDDGDSGPYVTSQTSVVNSGWVIISGPANDMGDKPAPFEFELSVSISGQETSDNITVDVTLDGKSVYSQAVAPNTPISIDVDTRTMRTGSHSFAVAATCDTYVPASGEYTFNVPEITIPDGGRMDQLEGQDGQVIFPITLARAVAGLENYGVESKVHPGAYTGTGTFGTDNPNTLEFEFEPKMVLIQGTAGRVAILIKPSGVGVSIGPNESTTLNVTWQGKTVSWYNALNAANQMNTENETYSYTAFG